MNSKDTLELEYIMSLNKDIHNHPKRKKEKMPSKDALEYITNLNKYINDNPEIARIEINIDLINTLEQIQKDLEILNILRNNIRISKANSIRVYLSNSVYASKERARDYKIVKKWLENNWEIKEELKWK